MKNDQFQNEIVRLNKIRNCTIKGRIKRKYCLLFKMNDNTRKLFSSSPLSIRNQKYSFRISFCWSKGLISLKGKNLHLWIIYIPWIIKAWARTLRNLKGLKKCSVKTHLLIMNENCIFYCFLFLIKSSFYLINLNRHVYYKDII